MIKLSIDKDLESEEILCSVSDWIVFKSCIYNVATKERIPGPLHLAGFYCIWEREKEAIIVHTKKSFQPVATNRTYYYHDYISESIPKTRDPSGWSSSVSQYKWNRVLVTEPYFSHGIQFLITKVFEEEHHSFGSSRITKEFRFELIYEQAAVSYFDNLIRLEEKESKSLKFIDLDNLEKGYQDPTEELISACLPGDQLIQRVNNTIVKLVPQNFFTVLLCLNRLNIWLDLPLWQKIVLLT